MEIIIQIIIIQIIIIQNGKGLVDNIDFDEGVKNNEDINKMICYTNMHQVIDYILQGRYSLCIIYLKIIVKELFEEYLITKIKSTP